MDASNQISDEGLEPSISDSSLYLYEYEWNEVERKELRKKFWVPEGILFKNKCNDWLKALFHINIHTGYKSN